MKLKIAWLTTNRTCNNNCKWCYARSKLKNLTTMNFDKAKALVDELQRLEVKRIILIGGEPTIYPNFIELIQYIREKNIRVSIATNGRKFIDREFAKKVLEAGINGIDFSLKAITEKEYFKNTKAYGLNEMLNGYKNLTQLGFYPSVSYVIVEDNYEEFDKLLSFIEKNNFRHFSFQFVKPVLEMNKVDQSMDLRKMGKFVEYMHKKLKETNINYTIEISFPLCLIPGETLKELIAESKIINCCHVPRGSGINFDEEFKIIPCNHFVDFPFSDSPVDFCNKNSIEEIMQSEIVKEFRNKARCFPTVKCQSCDLWEKCGGGCFVRWLSLDPNDYIN